MKLRFLQMKDTIADWPYCFHIAINKRAKEFLKGIQDEVTYFQEELIYSYSYEINEIQSIFQAFPKALGETMDSYVYGDKKNKLVIHDVAGIYTPEEEVGDWRTVHPFASYQRWCNLETVHLVPMIAEISETLNVHGKDNMRGGLLCEDEHGYNVLQILSWRGGEMRADDICLGILQELRDLDLFKKEDIQQHNLLWELCAHDEGEKRFNYLSNWAPDALKSQRSGGQLLLHLCTWLNNIRGFEMAFKAGMRHFPRDIGFLWNKNIDGETPYTKACEKYGSENVMGTIDEALQDPDCRRSLVEVEGEIRPFMFFAAYASSLDALYFLIRRDPPTLDFLEYEQSHIAEAGSIGNFEKADAKHVNGSLKRKIDIVICDEKYEDTRATRIDQESKDHTAIIRIDSSKEKHENNVFDGG